jgi:hypothetical protein
MNRKVKILVAVFSLFIGLGTLSGQGKEPNKVSELMKKKLQSAQKVLEGIALGDFDKIGEHGERLMIISKNLEWKVLKTPRYELYSNQFRRSLEGLIEKAKEKNLDGAALSYVEMTLSCVKCHKYVREIQTTGLNSDQSDALARLE